MYSPLTGKQTFRVLTHLIGYLAANPRVMDQLRCEVIENLAVCETQGVVDLSFLKATINGNESGLYLPLLTDFHL